MAAALQLRLDIKPNGWAHFTLAGLGEQFETEDVGYMTDALGDLVRAATELTEGATACQVSFEGEPAETRLVLTQATAGELRIEVLHFPDMYAASPVSGDLRLSITTSTDAFARAVLREADRIREAMPPTTYEDSWNMPFPTSGIEALRKARKA